MTRRTRFNIAANYLFFFTNALVGLIASPILLAFLGPAGFGAWKASQRLFDSAVSSDGGSIQALKWAVARQVSDGDPKALRRSIGAAITVWIRWLPLLLVAAVALALALPALIAGLDAHQAELIRTTGMILAANVLLAGLLNIPNAVLIGTNQGYAATLVRTVLMLLANGAMIVAASLGFGLPGLAVVLLATTIANGLLCWLVARRLIPWWGVEQPARSDIRAASAASVWLLIWAYLQRLLLASEIVLLSILTGAATVAAYVFTAYVAQFALAATQLTTSAYTPAMGQALGKGALEEADTIATVTRETTLVMSVASGCAILLLNPGFVPLWAGEASFMGHPANALIVLLLIQLAILRNEIQLQEVGLRMRRHMLAASASALCGLVFAVLFWVIWDSIEAILLGLLAGRLAGFILLPRPLLPALPRLVSCALMLGASYAAGLSLNFPDWTSLLIVAPPATLGLFVAAFVLLASPETRMTMIRRARGVQA